MKKYLILLTMLILLTGCGAQESEVSDTLEEPVETPEPLPVKYYYDLGGIYLDATAYFAPVGVIDDLEAWNTLKPVYAFQYSDGSIVYVGHTYDDAYSGFTYDDIEVCTKSPTILPTFDEALIQLDGAYTYEELEPAQVSLSLTIQQELVEQSIAGYDNPDVVMYAVAQTDTGSYVAVCKQDIGHTVQITYIKPEDMVCSLRDEESVLLIENTGELIPIEWYLNPNYGTNTDEVPEISP